MIWFWITSQTWSLIISFDLDGITSVRLNQNFFRFLLFWSFSSSQWISSIIQLHVLSFFMNTNGAPVTYMNIKQTDKQTLSCSSSSPLSWLLQQEAPLPMMPLERRLPSQWSSWWGERGLDNIWTGPPHSSFYWCTGVSRCTSHICLLLEHSLQLWFMNTKFEFWPFWGPGWSAEQRK